MTGVRAPRRAGVRREHKPARLIEPSQKHNCRGGGARGNSKRGPRRQSEPAEGSSAAVRAPRPGIFVSGCVVVIAQKLTYGNFVAIQPIAENKNTRRYWEDSWLGDLDSNQD